MNLSLYSENIEDYLKATSVIDFDNEMIVDLANHIRQGNLDEVKIIKATYEYVRDQIHHSIDINGKVVTLNASDVLLYKEGFCYAKSHLLAALLRANRISTGFCYQRLILDSDRAQYLVLHGLNAVYVSKIGRWVRVDARGNKLGIDAQFRLGDEKLAFPINQDMGEEDIMIVFDRPDINIIEKLRMHNVVNELLNDLPRTLDYMDN